MLRFLETVEQFVNPGWRWIYGMLATYGLRDHEVFQVDTSRLHEAPHVVEVLDDSKTGGTVGLSLSIGLGGAL